MMDDTALLRRFADDGSEASFRELVARRVDFVYATALRQVSGDTHLAQEIAQSVFLDLARKVRTLAHRTSITGWLYTSTRFAAAKARRSRVRRLNYESEAHTMQTVLGAQAVEINWSELRPVIDAALQELRERDREAILLRYFEGRSVEEVAGALGVAENTARMRIERALEKLRMRLVRRGIASTAAALAVALASQPAVVAPASLSGTITAAWLAGAGAVGSSFTLMNALKLLGGVVAAGVVGAGVAFGMVQSQWGRRLALLEAQANAATAVLRADNERLRRELARIEAQSAPPAPDPLADLRELVRAKQEKLLASTAFTGLLRTDSAAQLPAAVARVLNLSVAEKSAVENTLLEMRAELDLLAAANIASMDRPTSNRYVITFKLFPEGGAKLYDRFVAALAKTLGPERQSAVLTLMGEDFERVGSGFGARVRTVTVTRGAEAFPGIPNGNYTVNDTVTLSRTKVGYVRTGTRATIEREFPGITKLLPADF